MAMMLKKNVEDIQCPGQESYRPRRLQCAAGQEDRRDHR